MKDTADSKGWTPRMSQAALDLTHALLDLPGEPSGFYEEVKTLTHALHLKAEDVALIPRIEMHATLTLHETFCGSQETLSEEKHVAALYALHTLWAQLPNLLHPSALREVRSELSKVAETLLHEERVDLQRRAQKAAEALITAAAITAKRPLTPEVNREICEILYSLEHSL